MASKQQKWWQSLHEGQKVILGLVKIDRVGSTKEMEELPHAGDLGTSICN